VCTAKQVEGFDKVGKRAQYRRLGRGQKMWDRPEDRGQEPFVSELVPLSQPKRKWYKADSQAGSKSRLRKAVDDGCRSQVTQNPIRSRHMHIGRARK